MSVSRSLRFRVLARDGFACRYCGAKAPAVVLNVDHINPRSRGGSGHMSNLVTACYDCNMGKRDWLMADELIALVTPVVVEEPQRRRPERMTAAIIRTRRVSKTKKPAPLPLGLGSRGPYIGPDQPADQWRCERCGMICGLESDQCSCDKPRYYCENCRYQLDDEYGYEDGLCEECYYERELYCVDCGMSERVDGIDYCAECASEAVSEA